MSASVSRGTLNASASSRRTASFARPCSGAAVTRTFHASPCRPTICARPAPGLTRSRTRVDAAAMRPSVPAALGGFGLRSLDGRPRVLDFFDRFERGPKLCAELARLDRELLVLGPGVALHCTRLGVRLAENQVGLAARLLLHLCRCALRRDKRCPQQRFELAIAHEVGLELFDLVGEVGAFAPDVLEARGNLVEQPVHRCALVADEPRARSHVSDLNWCECHSISPLSGTDPGSFPAPGRG